MNPPTLGGRGGGGGFAFGGGAGGGMANTGDLLVSMTVGGRTYRQTFRVERVSGGEDAGSPFGQDAQHDQSGRYTPAAARMQKSRIR